MKIIGHGSVFQPQLFKLKFIYHIIEVFKANIQGNSDISIPEILIITDQGLIFLLCVVS